MAAFENCSASARLGACAAEAQKVDICSHVKFLSGITIFAGVNPSLRLAMLEQKDATNSTAPN